MKRVLMCVGATLVAGAIVGVGIIGTDRVGQFFVTAKKQVTDLFTTAPAA